MADVIFYTHATADTGFGHAARCGHLAGLLCDERSELDIVFEGAFDDGPRASLARMAPIRFAAARERARIGVYDRMDDTENPEVWSQTGLDDLVARCARVAFLANGISRPQVPEDVLVIGYKPGGPASDPLSLRWGLEYAPVAAVAADLDRANRNQSRALVALGGAHGRGGVRTALMALAKLPEIAFVDLLDSPVSPIDPDPARLRDDQTLEIHREVPSVAPLIARAGVVLASYGHLGYEALALGSPVCLVGQKAFQADYAQRLAALGVCVAAGRLDSLGAEDLAASLRRTLTDAEQLSIAAAAAVDGRGLNRIAGLLATLLDEAP